MQYDGALLRFPKEIRIFIAVFVIVLSVGYFTGLTFVNQTESVSPEGVYENYLGNEESYEQGVMKFKKGEREILTIIHTHILSMSFIFFLMGGLVWMTQLPKKLKYVLTIEPFLSILLTFGGIYVMWSGIDWFKYVVVFSGILMTLTFIVSSFVVLKQCLQKQS